MVNVKPAVYTELCKVATNVSNVYPSDWATFPVVQYTLENNQEYETLLDETETASYIRIKVDVWGKEEYPSDICISVTDKLKILGYRRTDYMDVPDPSGLKHSILRYEKIVE